MSPEKESLTTLGEEPHLPSSRRAGVSELEESYKEEDEGKLDPEGQEKLNKKKKASPQPSHK